MIGVYDSGLGGLAVLHRLRQRMPALDLLYLGDTAHLPYGKKSPSHLLSYARDALSFFEKHSAEAVIVACGTVSTVVLETQRLPRYPFPIFGVARPAAERTLALGCKRIAILATEATIRSGVYQALLTGHGAALFSLACPTLVPIAESSAIDPQNPHLTEAVDRALAPLRDFCPDGILLGCTHFPLFAEIIQRLYPSTVLIDCGAAAADLVSADFARSGHGQTLYCITGSHEAFRRSAERIDPCVSDAAIHKISLTDTR